jgi:hypothetical protein
MFKLFSQNSRDKKLKAEREAALKKSLADKLARYDERRENSDDSDFTLITIHGRKRLVRKQEITIHDQTALSV